MIDLQRKQYIWKQVIKTIKEINEIQRLSSKETIDLVDRCYYEPLYGCKGEKLGYSSERILLDLVAHKEEK